MGPEKAELTTLKDGYASRCHDFSRLQKHHGRTAKQLAAAGGHLQQRPVRLIWHGTFARHEDMRLPHLSGITSISACLQKGIKQLGKRRLFNQALYGFIFRHAFALFPWSAAWPVSRRSAASRLHVRHSFGKVFGHVGMPQKRDFEWWKLQQPQEKAKRERHKYQIFQNFAKPQQVKLEKF